MAATMYVAIHLSHWKIWPLYMCCTKHMQNMGVQLKVVYASSTEWPNLVTCLTDTHSKPTFCICTYLYVRILYKLRWSINIFLVLTQQFKKMIANLLNVRPVKVKLPPGATHAYVTFRYSVPLILMYHICSSRNNTLCAQCMKLGFILQESGSS